MKKPGFMLYHEDVRAMESLDDADVGIIVRAMCEFSETGTAPELPPVPSAVFHLLRVKIERDTQKYLKAAKKRAEALEKWRREHQAASKPKPATETTISETLPVASVEEAVAEEEVAVAEKVFFFNGTSNRKYFSTNDAWKTSDKARKAVAQNIIDGAGPALEGQHPNLHDVVVNYLAEGMPPETIAPILQQYGSGTDEQINAALFERMGESS